MTPLATLLAVLALLAAPGPTNVLLAAGGAERGWRGALGLVPVALAGYLATVTPLTLAGAALLDAAPGLRSALGLVAAAWVAWLAVGLWRLPPAGEGGAAVTWRRVLVTTLLNPKALVLGLVLLPADAVARALGNLALLALSIAITGAGWVALGVLARGAAPVGPPGLPPSWRRATALLLGGLSAWLVARVAGLA